MLALATDSGMAQLRATELPDPTPSTGEVRVRVTTSAINAADYKVIDGHLAGKALHGGRRPLVVGYDVAGTVDAVGAGVTELAVGEEVFGFLPYTRATLQGAYAEQVVLSAELVAPRPQHLSTAHAAALATAGVTALQALRDYVRLQPGENVLIIGASGGVGSVAVAVAKAMGAVVTGLCSATTADLVQSLGATQVLDYRKPDALAGEPTYDVIFDAAAMYSYGALRHLLLPGGSYVTTLPSIALLTGKLRAALSGHRCDFISLVPNRADLELLAEWSANMTLAIDSTYPVSQLAEALERSKRGGMRGRIVIEVAGGFA